MTARTLTLFTIGLAFAALWLMIDRTIAGAVQCQAHTSESCPR